MVELGEHGVIGVVTGTADIFWTSRVRPSTQLVLAKGGNEGTGHSGEKSNASEEYSATTSRLDTVVCRMTNPLKACSGGRFSNFWISSHVMKKATSGPAKVRTKAVGPDLGMTGVSGSDTTNFFRMETLPGPGLWTLMSVLYSAGTRPMFSASTVFTRVLLKPGWNDGVLQI